MTMTTAPNVADRFSHGTGPEPHAYLVAHDEPEPVQRDDESTDKLATLRADLKAAGWTAEVVRMSDADRAEMIRDYGIEG